MAKALILAAMAAPALFSPLAPALAAPEAICGERQEMVAQLTSEFREAPTAIGVVNGDAVLEVFVSASGTWTILATGTDGKSCLLSAGIGWDSTTLVRGEDS